MIEMFREFIATWDLFPYMYLSGWLMAALLSIVGLLVVARDQIFLGAAVSQASTLGIATAFFLAFYLGSGGESWIESRTATTLLAITFSVLAALVTAGSRRRRETSEAITGWVFLAASSLAILLTAPSPHGMEEVHKLLFSSIIAATPVDTWVFVGLTLATFVVVTTLHRPLLLFAMDPPMAAAVGMRVRRWTLLSYAWLGLVVGLSLNVSGLLYTFGCLVVPPLIAKNVARELRPMLCLSPAVAILVAALGFVVAHHYNLPPAQLTVFLLCLLLAAAWGLRRLRRDS